MLNICMIFFSSNKHERMIVSRSSQYLVLFTSSHQYLLISSHHQARPEITVLLLRISSKLPSCLVISYLV